MEDFKTLNALADYCSVSPEQLWFVATEGTTKDFDFAVRLSEACGISPQILMFQPTQNVRQGFLIWLERLTRIKNRRYGTSCRGVGWQTTKRLSGLKRLQGFLGTSGKTERLG